MGWLRRLKGLTGTRESAQDGWRRRWAQAVESPDVARADELRAGLPGAAGGTDDDQWEIEREMLDGLDAVVALARRVGNNGLPAVATGHRAVGTDVCHFTAKVSLPDDPAHPAGTLLLTHTRLVFVGGARGITLPWHALTGCLREDRDLVLGRADRQEARRIRFNSYADALQAAWLARHLAQRPAKQPHPIAEAPRL